MPELSGHMVVGRGNASGPMIGGYLNWCWGPKTIVAGAVTDEVWFGFIAPCDLRLEQISWGTRTTVTANVSLQCYVHPTAFQASGATALLTAAVDLDASAGANKSGFARAETGGATTLVNTSAARNIAKGSYVMAAATTDATGVVTDFHVEFCLFATGHVNADSTKD